MPLLPVAIPAGVYSNGTDLDAAGRWREANLVRWEDNSLRPIGGWQTRKASAVAAAPRALLAWIDNSADRWFAIGTYDALNVMSASGTVTDISPTSLTSGREDATANLGYGGGAYGAEPYGTPRSDTGTYLDATTWALDTWGEYLVACSPDDGRLVEWQLNTGVPAAAITNAPTSCVGLVVAEERFLMALGAGGDPRKVQWCDREDNTTWTPATGNEAGDQILQTDGRIMTGLRSRGGVLILTTTDAHSATYIGPPFVFSFERAGTQCGVVSRRGAVSVDDGVFWMGRNGFFRWAGGAVEELDCDVSDHVFTDINTDQISKVWAVSNSQHGEVWFFYPCGGSTEVDCYVAYNYRTGAWLTGTLDRTCGVDVGVFSTPVWGDSSGNLYNHETGYYLGGQTVYAESGPISIGAGDNTFTATHLYPDEAAQGEVQVTVKTRFYPNGDESTHGPYTLTAPTSVRFTGRQMRVRIEGATLGNWRAGTMRFDLQQRGRR